MLKLHSNMDYGYVPFFNKTCTMVSNVINLYIFVNSDS